VSESHLCFEAVAVGDMLPEIVRGPMSPMHLMRWSAAIENWHRIHYDWRFATQHDGLPDVLVNGSWKQHLLVQLVRGWVGDNGWLWKISYRFRKMDIAWDTLTAFGEVTELRRFDDFGVARCEIGIRNEREQSTEGWALAAIPYRDGQPVPYPFPQGLVW
jgi:hypothetical protein